MDPASSLGHGGDPDVTGAARRIAALKMDVLVALGGGELKGFSFQEAYSRRRTGV